MTAFEDRKIDVSTFPHEPGCLNPDLYFVRCGGQDYWACRGCCGEGVKRGLEYVALDFCDYCGRNVPEPDLAVVFTQMNGIEQKERVCSNCEAEAREYEVRPKTPDGGFIEVADNCGGDRP